VKQGHQSIDTQSLPAFNTLWHNLTVMSTPSTTVRYHGHVPAVMHPPPVSSCSWYQMVPMARCCGQQLTHHHSTSSGLPVATHSMSADRWMCCATSGALAVHPVRLGHATGGQALVQLPHAGRVSACQLVLGCTTSHHTHATQTLQANSPALWFLHTLMLLSH
jgi:hypothetical protein